MRPDRDIRVAFSNGHRTQLHGILAARCAARAMQ
jgi:hypothetical protein